MSQGIEEKDKINWERIKLRTRHFGYYISLIRLTRFYIVILNNMKLSISEIKDILA